MNPTLIIEAGVRSGDGSTIPLKAITKLFSSKLIGLDIDYNPAVYADVANAQFLAMDDRLFGNYFQQHLLPANQYVDFVFIDTSHEYYHTFDEINVFSQTLSENGALGFHDSNVTPLGNNDAYQRLNGTSTGSIYGNPHGVSKAIKNYFDIQFDRTKYNNSTFERHGYLWHFIHYPFCNGFTFIKRLQPV